jgi:hypothetical protein
MEYPTLTNYLQKSLYLCCYYTDYIIQIIAVMKHKNPTIKVSFLAHTADVQEPVKRHLELKLC